ncbi:chymotrypsin-like [Diabrotica undecimpunctata]|uniref:chymotrypsin-like n=1 Tax=Diabrotica undecimpunctata TaxID=50387 RepID=UPI003B64004F
MKTFAMLVTVLATASCNLIFSTKDELPPFRHPTVDPVGSPDDLPDDPNLQIIHGDEVKPHSIPYQIYLIGRSSFQSWSCGGSIISPKTVITAAHCVDGATSIEITLGAHNLKQVSPGQITVNAASWKQHEKYDRSTIDNDIAVVILPNEIPVSPTINYSKLPSKTDVNTDFVGDNARVSGWGVTTSGGGSVSDVLRQVNNTIISNFACNEVFGIVKNEEICLSGAEGKTACNGDSGGPLVIGDIQVGVVSYGVRWCISGYPSVYCRTTKFLDWIEDNSDWRGD